MMILKNMYKLFLLIFIATLLLAALAFFSKKKPSPELSVPVDQIVLYYGDGCPHCANVEEYLNQNPLPQNYPLVKKEVYGNKVNSRELIARAKNCGQSESAISIPFLYDKGTCLVGDVKIIDYFQSLK